MSKPAPKNQTELEAMSDEDLQKMRDALTAEADKLRAVRQALAREAERRTLNPTKKDD